MSLKDKKLLSLHEIEGVISPHDEYLKREMGHRKEALEYVDDVAKLAEYIGGKVESLGIGENWVVKKEIFPGVEIFFVFNHADDEFAANLRVLYSGDGIKKMRGEDLASIAIACANHMLRYVRETNPGKSLPQICYKV